MNDEISIQPAEAHEYPGTLIHDNLRKDSYKTLTEENESLGEDNTQSDNKYSTGRWSQEEHNKFIEAMFLYGNEWKRVQQHIKSRSSTQARSHAQKFFIRLKKKLIEENLDHEMTLKPTNKRNEMIMSWIQENVSCDVFGSRKNDSFYIEKRDKLCKIIMNLISNPIKRKTSPKVTPVRNCCGLSKRNYKECDQVCCINIIDEPLDGDEIFKIEKIKQEELACNLINSLSKRSCFNEDESKNDPFKLSFCDSEKSVKKEYSEINNFDLDYFFSENNYNN
jgi:SHAQKYF class myb-like DNA-binding protein